MDLVIFNEYIFPINFYGLSLSLSHSFFCVLNIDPDGPACSYRSRISNLIASLCRSQIYHNDIQVENHCWLLTQWIPFQSYKILASVKR